MRHAAQCVGRAIRGKTDYGIMVFADKVIITNNFSMFFERPNLNISFVEIFKNR